ncbi:hypothetical protein O6H91_16G077700 [Diphasiastrum complanatum]|uniref:Uncharacterized protein n=1 Tax=Diphasiastrum complanatum TaxID=34168 RepID=A0ACC2BDS2_DIPCM|nr:hypothetical protein O6H91_16G077700 [Diphasiastrum complanatum]
MAPIDPHSFTDSAHPLTKHIDLDLFLDFDTKIITGTATLTLEKQYSGELYLDTRDLAIEKTFDAAGKPLQFVLEAPHPIKGSLLRVFLHDHASFSVSFKTSPSASAVQWLDPLQTASGRLPYVFTQCQAIHARSIFPCQDTPAARITYSANINVPRDIRVVMSAAHVEISETHISDSRTVEKFVMEQPIPPYLFALAAGDIVYEEVGPRTRVYAEPPVVKAAAHEFAGAEEMVKQAEALFGPYDWERFDLLVMPPSFPYGGMENPRMVFLTPTVIAGDRSGVGVVAHELAHSWTGNLITNASADDFWLNEGFTTYAERRIVEALDGKERLALHLAIGWNGLQEEIQRFNDRPEFTKLKTNQEDVDPDDVYSRIPYEKGSFFLRRLEIAVGRPQFDGFLKKYIETFRFKSINTETFLSFLTAEFPYLEQQVDLESWIYKTGIPPDADVVKPKSQILEKILELAEEFQAHSSIVTGSVDDGIGVGANWHHFLNTLKQDSQSWQAQEWQIFLETLPKKINVKLADDLENLFNFSISTNWEIKIAFLTIAANSGYQKCFPAIESALHTVGRMKYLKPLYSGLLDSTPEAKELAKHVFAQAKGKYHPIAQTVIQGLLKKSNH